MAAPVSQPPVAARASTRFLPRGLGALPESAPASLRFSIGRRHRAARLGMTTGTPIHVFVPNTDQRGGDYSEMAKAYRPSHADATYDFKYGVRAVQILAFVSKVHQVVLPEDAVDYETVTLEQVESNIVRCPDPEYAEKMIAAIDKVRVRGDSIGGVVTCIARNVPRGLGSPVFDKLEAELAKAMLSLPASKGFEIGSGFAGTDFTGSEHNDEFYMDEAGNGGISNGEIIYFKVAFKPTATIGKKQNTVSREHQDIELLARGRHDPCVVPRAVPMVESMAALVLMDQLMAHIAQCEMFPLNLALQEPIGSASSASELAPNLS
ncbi:Chorismate synthase, chloroplastic [Dichanthelium oligosanthes]|uniref:chorismate synthase n=1 Tax=Dichanthelium oligosanthes TaxID=888268 RepID=A0A1E5UML0_9POAL|nr:Chorismate synthase, chloroplastic [Dichanthelium oligosanthes]